MNLFSILEDAAKQWPEDVAIAHKEGIYSYVALCSAAEFLAKELEGLGIEEGDKVGIMCRNGAEHIAAAFAVLRVGGIIVSVPPSSRAEETASLAEQMALDGFCYSVQFAPVISQAGMDGSRSVSLFSSRGNFVLSRTQRRAPRSEREKLLKIKAATIYFSSGTTGRAKGVIVSHESLLERAKTYCEAASLQKGDAVLWLRPMARSEIYGFLLQGIKILLGDALDTRFLARVIRQHRVTHIFAAPMFYRAVLSDRNITAEDFRSVRYFLSGATALGKPIADAFAAQYGREIVEHYGLTESGTVLVNLSQDASKRGSVGVPVRAEVKLRSEDDGEANGEGTGELLVRCPGMFDAYYQPWRLREEVLEGGLFMTGDLARRDADGYYWIVGRVKDVINVGGVKVFPSEIEELLLSHPAVDEAVVFGAPEPRFGEAPHAKVKLKAGTAVTERELLRHVNERVSVFKSLRGVEFVAEIPKTVTGKPRRTVHEI